MGGAMLKRVWIQGYRCFQDVTIELKPLQILVGPNGSGKSAFLDAVRFVEDIVRNGLRRAIARRVWNPEELVWEGKADGVEIELTWEWKEGEEGPLHEVTYAIALERQQKDLRIAKEYLKDSGTEIYIRRGREVQLFGKQIPLWADEDDMTVLAGIFLFPGLMRSELMRSFPMRLQNLQKWMVNAWPEFLHPHPFAIRLGGRKWEEPRHHRIYPNARNLALVMDRFQRDHPEAYRRWLEEMRILANAPLEFKVHVDEVTGIHRVAMRWDGLWVSPSGITDGWLRFMALSLPAYDPKNEGRIFFIEEIENGLSPDAIEMLFRIMEETPEMQWLVTSHHPLLVRLAGPERLLIFSRDKEGVRVVSGDRHPLLANLDPRSDLADLLLARIFL